MEEIILTKQELEKMYQIPPDDFEKETEFQTAHRMGRNSLILEFIGKINKNEKEASKK